MNSGINLKNKTKARGHIYDLRKLKWDSEMQNFSPSVIKDVTIA